MATRIEIIATDPTYLVWIGDGAKNDANAIMYIKNNGSAYFGGSLSAGALRNSVTSTAVTYNPSVITPRFGTNGNPKTVTVNFSYSNSSIDFNPPPTGSTSITLRLERRRNGTGAWVQLGSDMTYTGSSSSGPFEPGDGYPWQVVLFGSTTFTDNSTGTQDFEYRVTRIANSGAWPYIAQTNFPGQQNLTVTSVEN